MQKAQEEGSLRDTNYWNNKQGGSQTVAGTLLLEGTKEALARSP